MDQSFSARPFRFDTIFENAPVIGIEDDLDNQLSAAALKAELAALRASRADDIARAKAEGAAEAEEALRAERDEALLAAIDALHGAWDEFEDQRASMIDTLRGEAVDLAVAIAETLAGHALTDAPTQAIDEAIGRALALVERGQEIIVAVHGDLLEPTRARVADRQSRDRRKLNIIVEAEANIAPGDAHLRWDNGALRLDKDARRQAIEAELLALRPAS